jgi:hypothetical protein
MMSEYVSKIVNNLMSDASGIDFDFIAITLKEAPEDLRRFSESLEAMIETHTGKASSFRHGFILSDQLNIKAIESLEAKLQVAVEGLEDARDYHADCLYGIDTLQVLKLEDCTCGICETLKKIKAK